MRQLNSFLLIITVLLFHAHQLAGKLAIEHSPKSLEMLLSNAIYSSKNNEFTEAEQLNGAENVAKEVLANAIEEEPSAAAATAAATSTLLEQLELKVVNLNDVVGVHNNSNTNNNNNSNKKTTPAYQAKKNKMKNKKIPANSAAESQQQQLIRRNENGKLVNSTQTTTTGKTATTQVAATKRPPAAAATVAATSNVKSQRPNSFINPFGQLSALLGGDQLHQLHDYNFLFNAERHTIFRLHTTLQRTSVGNTSPPPPAQSGRVLNVVVGNSLSSAFGAHSTIATGAPLSKVEEVQLYDATSLRQSRFNPFNPTRLLIHGWFGGSNAGVYNVLVPEYLKLGNGSYNIFTVDWGRGAFADYITASYRVKPVGKVVAKFIDFLHSESGMRFEDLHVIGFSMGAHIAGIAGKHVQTGRLPIIYALDPALPLFRYEHINERIALTDADYVEVIHTSVGSYGYDRPLGHVDFYVNYGSGQPGCLFNECSHMRAYLVLAESLQAPQAFRGQGCDVKLWFDLIRNRRCLMGTGRNLTMGGDPTDVVALRKRGGGVYYFVTNAVPPFAKS